MVSFSNFRTLDPEMADTARELIGEPNRRRLPFLPFMNTWMAFSGWMESVTGGGPDATMITALAENRRMIECFDRLLEDHAAFRERTGAFADLWPVLNVRDVRKKLGYDAFFQMNRDALMSACLREDVKMQPVGWTGRELPTSPQRGMGQKRK